MKIKDAFILSAGLGSRMGELGKKLPKPLFPIFDKSIIEILIDQLKSLGVENIYVNCHHHEELFKNYLESKSLNIKFLSEPTLLGSGGAFYNLKSSFPHLKYILSMNADTIFDLNESVLKSLEDNIFKKKVSVSLMGLNVEKERRFNRLEFKNNILKKIVKYEEGEDIQKLPWTFSGVALVNLESLEEKYFGKASSFFDSVANYKNSSVGISLPINLKYHDFGTLDYYLKNLKKISENNEDFLNKWAGALSDKPTEHIAENDLCLVKIIENELSYQIKR